ncbi:MAG: hypothetical protein D6729_04360, partial [Deltaproteobacteria bacterium]
MDSVLALLALVTGVYAHRAAWRERGALLTLLVLDAVAGLLALVAGIAPETFGRWMQEDGPAEWATFWAFLLAGALVLTRLKGLFGRRLALVLAVLLSAFCLFVAGEEISWGQRLFGFEPPALFLEKNFQQELNVHNFLKGKKLAGLPLDSRYLVLLVALSYGALLPLLRRLLARRSAPVGQALEAIAPPVWLLPHLLLVAYAEARYPVVLTGEAAELHLGHCFLAAEGIRRRGVPWRRGMGWVGLALGLGIGSSLALGPLLARLGAGRVETARSE